MWFPFKNGKKSQQTKKVLGVDYIDMETASRLCWAGGGDGNKEWLIGTTVSGGVMKCETDCGDGWRTLWT